MVAGLIMIASDGCRQQLTQWLHLCAVAKEHKSPTGIFPLALDLQHGPVVSPMPYFVVSKKLGISNYTTPTKSLND